MRYIASLLLLSVLANSASAQITITADEYFAVDTGHTISTIGYNQDSINVPSVANSLLSISAISGAGVTWDFTNIEGYDISQYNSAYTKTYLHFPGGAALSDDPDFAGATIVIKNTPSKLANPTYYVFYKFDSTGEWSYGETREDSNGTKSKVISYVPPIQQWKFPLTYGTSWHSSSIVNSSFEPKGTIYTDTTDYIVDSYGTLISPTTQPPSSKTSSNSIRLKTIDIQRIDTSGIEKNVIVNRVISYQWFTLTGFAAFMNGYEGKNMINASYTEGIQNSVKELSIDDNVMNLHISQNPASNSELKISCTLKKEGYLQVNLFDPLGRNLRTVANVLSFPGENIIPLDPLELPNGIYFLCVNADGMTATSKIIIQK